MYRHAKRVLRAWLYPLKSMEAWQGWASVLYVSIVFAVPVAASVVTALSKSIRAGVWTLVLFLVALLALALRALWRAIPYPEPTAVFSVDHTHHRLKVVVRKGGKALNHAAILLTVPAEFGSLSKVTKGDDYRYADAGEDGRITWDEAGLFIAGGGSHPTTWDFRTVVPPGDHPITLQVSDDGLPRAAVIHATLKVPVTEAWTRQREEARARELNWLRLYRERLQICRAVFSDSLGADQWDPNNRAVEYHRGGQQRAHRNEFLDEDDIRAINVVYDAFDSISLRYNQMRNERQRVVRAAEAQALERATTKEEVAKLKREVREAARPQPDIELVSDDGIDPALANCLEAIRRLDRAVRSAEAPQ